MHSSCWKCFLFKIISTHSDKEKGRDTFILGKVPLVLCLELLSFWTELMSTLYPIPLSTYFTIIRYFRVAVMLKPSKVVLATAKIFPHGALWFKGLDYFFLYFFTLEYFKLIRFETVHGFKVKDLFSKKFLDNSFLHETLYKIIIMNWYIFWNMYG